jgi:CopG family nickel-responsive transcriptional regulator
MSLPKDLLRDFDDVLKDVGYNSRSKGIRDAINDYITRHNWMSEMEGERIGTISLVYNRHYTGMMEDLSDIQYEFNNYIKSISHVQVNEKSSLDIIVVQGDAQIIRKLTEKIGILKGVEHIHLNTTKS